MVVSWPGGVRRVKAGWVPAKGREAARATCCFCLGEVTGTPGTKGTGPFHHLHADEVVRLLGVDLSAGLSDAESQRRLGDFGPNLIHARASTPGWRLFARQLNQPLVYLLLGAGLGTGLLGEWMDSAVIVGVVLVNAAVGFLQESKAENAIGALAGLLGSGTTVRRGGRLQRICAEALVPGDVVILGPGDRVPGDLRLFQACNLQVDESALTGESLPALKHTDPLALETILADRRNVAFAGTLVTSGQGEGVVWATGDRTEAGRIAWLIAGAVELETPLTRKVAEFSRLLLWVILFLAAATFLIGVARGEPVKGMLLTAVGLAVGTVPEGLPAAVTIVLAIGVTRMARRRAIIRQLPAVETLGSTTVICSDKTGTLTENQMTVREIFAGGNLYEITGVGYQQAGEIRFHGTPITPPEHPAVTECLRAGLLCNEAQLTRDEGGQLQVLGDPTEAAFLVSAGKAGLIRADIQRAYPRRDMIPFEPEHMFRATLHGGCSGGVIYKVGAVERLLDRCTDALGPEGKSGQLDREAVQRAARQMAARGLRVLAFARRHTLAEHARLEHSHVGGGLTFLGLQGMIDPPRPEVIAAVRRCHEAGISVKMITGDHLLTAHAIARQVGLNRAPQGLAAPEEELVSLTGRELDNISDEKLPEIAERTVVFARVVPEQKLRLVRALQTRGHIVAMTGDGVNDAPALRQADIGIAMGRSGTDVAKGAAAMVLADDNFASIEAAVEEGRGVFDNITKFIVWILPTNLGEGLLLIVAIFLGLPLPALPLQLLWINLTDTLLGLPLSFEPKEGQVMRRLPRRCGQPLLTFSLMMRTGLVSLLMLAGALWLFTAELKREDGTLAIARTATVNLIVLVEAVYLFNCRSLTRPCFSTGFCANPWVFVGAFGMLGAQFLFTYAPLMNRLFHTAPLNIGTWLHITVVAIVVFALVEFEKWLRYRSEGGRHPPPGPAQASFPRPTGPENLDPG